MDAVTLGMAKADARRKYTPRGASSLVGAALQANVRVPDFALSTDTATVTLQSAVTITGNEIMLPRVPVRGLNGSIRLLGMAPSYNLTYLGVEALNTGFGSFAVETDLYGDRIEIKASMFNANPTYWVWVDGKPLTADAVAGTATAQNVSHLHILFDGGVKRRRVTIYLFGFRVRSIIIPTTAAISPTPKRPITFAAVGDSLTQAGITLGSDTASYQKKWARYVAEAFGWEYAEDAIGGSGYVTPGSGLREWKHASRLAAQSALNADLYLFVGSVNDDSQTASAITAAAEACYENLWQNNPDAKIIVFGPTQTGATASTAAAVRTNAAAVRTAAMNYANKNVIGFIDMLGTKTTPAAWTSNLACTVGTRYVYNGGVYECVEAYSGSTWQGQYFRLITPLYGTGRQGTTASNGNRDVAIQTDNVHWSSIGHGIIGQWITDQTIAAVRAYAAGDFYLSE